MSTLTVCTMTSNSSARLEHWVQRVLEYADELVIFVDSNSTDWTLDLAQQVADQVCVFDHPAVNSQVMDRCARSATGDWILWLDDDELMHRDFEAALRPLLDDTWVTHYLFPYRWMIEEGDSVRWVASFPWNPDPHLRMWRNIGSTFWHRGRPHSPFDVLGEGRLLQGDELAIWHSDFLLRDRAAREAKLDRYRHNVGPSHEEYYLWEDAGPLDLRAFDEGAVVRAPTALGSERAAERRERSSSAGRSAATRPVALAGENELTYWNARHRIETDIFHAAYDNYEGPLTLAANQGANAKIRVRNTSSHPWRTTGLEPGQVVLSYHWEHELAGLVLRNGDVSILPYDVAPGDDVEVDAGVWAPYEPGEYTLVWDLRAEGINWFSERGVTPMRHRVQVIAGGRRTSRPRVGAELPARWARTDDPGRWATASRWGKALNDTLRSRATLRASNLRPIPPQRVLDSRTGTGVPGVPIGPLEAGHEIVVDVGDQHLVPIAATGIVGTIAVVNANYNGFVSITPSGSAARPVNAYFTEDAAPSSAFVVVALGTGPHAGRISLRLSESESGGAQLLFDLTGYLS